MSTSIIYINTPFSQEEHDAIKALADSQGRSKGQQLRSLALSAMGYKPATPDCDLAPGIDLVTFLEGPDGILNQLRLVFGIAKEPDAPRVVEESAVFCRLSVLWNEVEIVNRVLLTFKSHPSLSAFLLLLVSTLSHLNDAVDCCKGGKP